MELSKIRQIAGISTQHADERRKQIVTETKALLETLETTKMTDEQLDELFGGLGQLASNAFGGAKKMAQAGAQKVQAGAQRVAQGASNAAGAVKQQYQQGETKAAYFAAAKALQPLAQTDPKVAKIIAYLVKQAKMVGGQAPQQAAPQQAAPVQP